MRFLNEGKEKKKKKKEIIIIITKKNLRIVIDGVNRR